MRDKRSTVYLIILSFFIAASCVLAAPENSSKVNLTLENVILIAFKNNKDIQIVEKNIPIARAQILGARSAFLPRVDVDASYTYNDKTIYDNIFTGFINDNLVALSASQSIYNGGANWAAYKQAELNLNVAQESVRAVMLDIEFDAKRLYYGLLYAYENERIAKESVEQAKAHYRDVEAMYNQGTASRFDLLQSKVQISLVEPDLVMAQNEINSLKAELNKFLSRNVNTPIDPAEVLAYTLVNIQEDTFLQEAYLNKPEMKLKALGVDINLWGIRYAKAGYRPDVSISALNYYRSNDLGDMFNREHNNWSAGIAVHIPIFEGFSTKAKVDEAKARYAQSMLDKDNIAEQIAVDIRNACLDLRSSLSIINSQKDNVDVAREALRISEVSYKNGVATNLDVMDAQVSLSSVQKNLASGIYDYLMAEAYLHRNTATFYAKKHVKEALNEEK